MKRRVKLMGSSAGAPDPAGGVSMKRRVKLEDKIGGKELGEKRSFDEKKSEILSAQRCRLTAQRVSMKRRVKLHPLVSVVLPFCPCFNEKKSETPILPILT